MNKFDYSILAVPVPYDEARNEVTEIPTHYKNIRIAFIAIAVIVAIQIVVLRAYEHWFIIPLLVVPYIGAGMYYYNRFRIDISRTAGLYRFAKANDMHAISSVDADQYPGALFNEGHTRRIVMALRTKDENEAVEVGNYRYVTGTGRNATTHNFTYMLIKLDKVVPHIFVDSKQNNSWWYREHASNFAKNQQLKFEGDFNTYFKVLVPDDYAKDALYIFTPDVLQSLLDYGKDYDFEFMGDTLIMFKRGQVNLADSHNLESMFSKAMLFASQFRKQTKLYRDERAAAGEVNTIATGGQRLRYAFPWLLVIFLTYFAVNAIIGIFYPHLFD